MDKFFQYLYYIFLTLFVAFVTYLTAVLFAAPRKDALDRGFILCTKQLVGELSDYESSRIGRLFGVLWRDMKCNIGVIVDGGIYWIQGKQKTPWANYLFEPQLSAAEDENPYITQADAVKDMSEIEQQSDFIERKQKELDEAKSRRFNLDSDVILNNPDVAAAAPKTKSATASENDNPQQGDIADETNIKIISSDMTEGADVKAPQAEDVLKNIKDKTAEKLPKGD